MTVQNKQDPKRNLEENVKQQNLIHELVMINELLLLEADKLKKQNVESQQQVLHLWKQNKLLRENQSNKPLDDSDISLQKARREKLFGGG